MKNYVRVSFVLIVAMMFAIGCGKNEENQEQPVDDIGVLNNENNDNEVNEENENDEDVSSSNDHEFTEAALELTEPLEEIKEYYNSIYFSDVNIIDQEEGLIGIKVSNLINEKILEATVNAYTIDPQARMTLVVTNSEDEFEAQANKSDLSGDAMAEEVKEGVYEFADSLIWTEEGNSYRLKGGRRVLSTVEENNIDPAEDRLAFYENLTKTNNELDDVNEFVDKIIIPTSLPSDYDLSFVTIEKNTNEIMFSSYPIELVYGLKDSGGETLYFITYGKYEHAPMLVGDGLEEIEVEGVTVQSKEDDIMFTLGDETYRINYSDLALNNVLEIAKSMIVQFK